MRPHKECLRGQCFIVRIATSGNDIGKGGLA
jgi:hypothetical protein